MVSRSRKKVVLITGCDTGFGRLLAMKLCTLNEFHVVAGCLNETGRSQYEKLGNISTLLFDVTKADQVNAAIQEVSKICDGNGLYGVINNAGIVQFTPFELASDDSFRRVMEVNFFGMVAVTRGVLPLLRQYKGNARVVNVASVCGLISLPNHISYCCSKYAVEAFSDGLRREMLAFNVSVHCIEPGIFKTELAQEKRIQDQVQKSWEEANDELRSAYKGFEGLAAEIRASVAAFESPRPEKVVNAICHALTSNFPKMRYAVGWDANLMWKPTSMLPGWMQNVVLFHVVPFYLSLDPKKMKIILGTGLLSLILLMWFDYATTFMMALTVVFATITIFK